jgi:hypothetical protein
MSSEPRRLGRPPFEQLDFIYQPTEDVAADMAYLEQVLGGRIVFAIDAMGARVAMVELAVGPPQLLLTDHLKGERPILIYQVADLAATLAGLKSRGWKEERTIEIPPGPCCSFVMPGGHRIAFYQPTRPDVLRHFEGRRDF